MMSQYSLICPGGPKAETTSRYSHVPVPWGPLPMGNMLCYPWKINVPDDLTADFQAYLQWRDRPYVQQLGREAHEAAQAPLTGARVDYMSASQTFRQAMPALPGTSSILEEGKVLDPRSPAPALSQPPAGALPASATSPGAPTGQSPSPP